MGRGRGSLAGSGVRWTAGFAVSFRAASTAPRCAACARWAAVETVAGGSVAGGERGGDLWIQVRRVHAAGGVGPTDVVQALKEYADTVDAARVDVLRRYKDGTLVLLEALASLDGGQSSESPGRGLVLDPPLFGGFALFPSLRAWRREPQGSSGDGEGGGAAPPTPGARPTPEAVLDGLGVKAVQVFIAVGAASDGADLDAFLGECAEEARRLVSSGEALRAAAVPLPRSNTAVLLTAYPSGSDFALFDSSIADDHLDDRGWAVDRYDALHPPSTSWALPADVLAEAWGLPELEPLEPLEPLDAGAGSSAPPRSTADVVDPAQHYDPLRVWLGVGTLEKAQRYIRESPHTFLAVTGWNQARVDPLVWGLENEADDGVIIDLPGLKVEDTALKREDVLEGVRQLHDRGHRAVVAYGSGKVMDGARAIAALGAVSPARAAELLDRIEEEARTTSRGLGVIQARAGARPLTLVLIPNGPGAEAAYVSTSVIRFGDTPALVQWDEGETRIVAGDPRLLRRMHPPRMVETAAAVTLCWCVEAMLATDEDEVSSRLASDGLTHCVRVLLSKRWERQDDDSFFKSLATASMMAGSARDATGLGIAQALALYVAAAVGDPVLDLYTWHKMEGTILENVEQGKMEEQVNSSSFAGALVHITPHVAAAGLYDERRLQCVAERIVDKPTTTRLISYLRRQAGGLPPPPQLPRAALQRIAEACSGRAYVNCPAGAPEALLLAILEKACSGPPLSESEPLTAHPAAPSPT